MGLAQEIPYTIDYIYSLPDGQRAELIDGQIYDMSTPDRRHQRLVQFFSRIIGNYISLKGGFCEVYPAPFAVRLYDDDYTYVEPDISVICDPKKLDDKGCNGAPDWIIEVISPSTRMRDYITKLYNYRNAGVREYWIVDADKNRITVYRFDVEGIEEYSFNDTVPVGIYDDFSIDFSSFGM